MLVVCWNIASSGNVRCGPPDGLINSIATISLFGGAVVNEVLLALIDNLSGFILQGTM